MSSSFPASITPYIRSKYIEITYSPYPTTEVLKFKPLTQQDNLKTWLWAQLQNLKHGSKFGEAYVQYIIDDYVYVSLNPSYVAQLTANNQQLLQELIQEIESFRFPIISSGSYFTLKFIHVVSQQRLKVYSLVIDKQQQFQLRYSLEDVICLMFPSDQFIVHAFDVYCAGERNDPTSDMFQVQILVESIGDCANNQFMNNGNSDLLTQVDPDQDIANLLEALSFQDQTPCPTAPTAPTAFASTTANDTLPSSTTTTPSFSFSTTPTSTTTTTTTTTSVAVANSSAAAIAFSFSPDKMVRSVYELFV
ncbi:unnamed protein product [Ambrosiozyma monospora]|uniref:Unnamed protein product n=1 Tax=Ambrosiozyma monospora TaxID=43982 RepID=A0A9W7DF97_AMBMO|nr:unnamed protein product [Ambrosiozyma monospora]